MPNVNSAGDMFPARLVSARKMRALSQEQVAEKSGLKPAAVSHFETGARKPSFDNLRRLSDALNVTADYLLGRSEDMESFAEAAAAYRDGLEQLTDEQRKVALNVIEALKNQPD